MEGPLSAGPLDGTSVAPRTPMRRMPSLFLSVTAALVALAPPAFAAEPAQGASPPTVELHVVAPRESGPVIVWQASGERVCDAPCDVRVNARGLYMVMGPLVMPSAPFRLREPDAPGEAVVARVDPTTKRDRQVGWGVAIAGMSVAGAGLLQLLAYGVIAAGDSACPGGGGDGPCTGSTPQSPPLALAVSGGVTLGVGAVLLLSGLFGPGSTTVDMGPPHDEPSRARDNRWARLPVWREVPATAAPAAASIPVFTTAF